MNSLSPHFEPTRAAAWAALERVQPHAYAGSRNHLMGAATQLSPYFTHGLLTQREAFDFLNRRAPLHPQHKLVYEFGWRAYFHHVWAQLGEGIFGSLHPGPLPDAAYQRELPDDVREARTGVPVIDQAVGMLYATGHLHNHARMWLASYLVHVRKVFWRVGADWLYGHLLDGDLASNHLSWQWVAGTGSHKPYLFNAQNVARFAPPDWHSPGSVIDTSYEALDALARSPAAAACPPHRSGMTEPPLRAAPVGCPLAPVPDLAGRHVVLQHPWALGATLAEAPADALVLGLLLSECHQRHPWSDRRWRFVLEGWERAGVSPWWADAAELHRALAPAASVWLFDDPHLHPWRTALPPHTRWLAREPLFAEVAQHCASFSRWWQRTQLR